MVYWEWGVDKTFACRRTSQRNVWWVPWCEASTRLHLQYHAKTYMAESQLQVSECNNYSLLPGHHLLPLLFPFLLSVVFLPLLASQLTFITHARTYTKGRADRNPPQSKGEEEEIRKTAKDDIWLIAKVISYGYTFYIHSGKLLSCLQQQGLSLPEWRKMSTSHLVSSTDDTRPRNIPVHKHRHHQTGLFRHSPHLRKATTKVEEIPRNFDLMSWNTCISSLEEGKVINSASSFTVDTTECKLTSNSCYNYIHRHYKYSVSL